MEKTNQSSRKPQKVSDGKLSIDRLSNLSDDVLCHILSFLPTKLSVATSVLARSWRFLWTDVPNLDFDSKKDHIGTGFSNIINRVMLLHKVRSINTFRLCHMDEWSDTEFETWIDTEFETWITTVIARKVRNLDISLHYQLMLPQCFFTCKTLVDLRLNCHARIPMSGVVYLPALKKLQLNFVEYESSESLSHLLYGCPVLQVLIIDIVSLDPNLVCFYISSPTLIRLMLNSRSYPLNEPDNTATFRVRIDTPQLRYLQVQDSMSEVVSDGPLTSLIEADIVFDCDEPVEGVVYYSRHSAIEFVGRLCNVKCLKLSSACVNVPDSAFYGLAKNFHNLTELELAADWRFLLYFLGNAENLQVLIIREVKCWMDPHQVPTCLSSRHLTTVTIDQFGYTEHEFELIRYLLWNAKVLKKMEICSQRHGIDLEGNFDAVKRISLFQRGSETCELGFH